MKNEARKLKRGLKDLSVLFHDGETSGDRLAALPRQVLPSIGIESLSVFDSRGHADSSLFLSYCASKLANYENLCSVLCIGPSHLLKNRSSSLSDVSPQSSALLEEESLGHYFNRFTLTWEQFKNVCHGQKRECSYPHKNGARQTLFFDFDYENVPHFQSIIPVLDKCLLVVQSQAENVTETYKMMKATVALNPDLDYYFIYDGFSNDRRGAVLFERFSEMAARRLGIHLTWLGYFHMDGGAKKIFEDLNYELLFMNRRNQTGSIEKFIFADLVRPNVHAEMRIAV